MRVALLLVSLSLLEAAPIVLNQHQDAVLLHHAAQPNVWMPVTGLGTGGYTSEFKTNTSAEAATLLWLKSGGRRIDTALNYGDQVGIGRAMRESGIPRSDIFVTSKVGPTDPLGFNDTLSQFKAIQDTLQTSYVDLLLIHWPGVRPKTSNSQNSTDPHCQGSLANSRSCRQSTWRAMMQIFKQGGARAIGVSNFEVNHLEDILMMKELVPAVNEFEFHPYWHETDLLKFCLSQKIVVNGYSPLGAPDVSSASHGWNLLDEPHIVDIASKYKRTPAEVILQWELGQGVLVNPRTNKTQHMMENLHFYKPPVPLTAEDFDTISSLKHADPKICPDPHGIP